MTEFRKEQLAQMNRERVQRHRDNKRMTLVKVEVWIKPENKKKLLSLVKDLAWQIKDRYVESSSYRSSAFWPVWRANIAAAAEMAMPYFLAIEIRFSSNTT
mgnify:CR=1 FL=1